jgi:acetylglutamate kinase
MLAAGRGHAGMLPKLQGIAAALRGGVGSAHILDGRLRHALLLELFTDKGVGTMVSAGEPAPPRPAGPQALSTREVTP